MRELLIIVLCHVVTNPFSAEVTIYIMMHVALRIHENTLHYSVEICGYQMDIFTLHFKQGSASVKADHLVCIL